jgi:hypothetical protein
MIVKQHIERDLARLRTLYTQSVAGPDARVPVYYCKLGVLELSGWVEEAFDLIAYRAVKRRVRARKFERLVDDAIKRTYGFSYDGDFLRMMAKVVGMPECERLEEHLDSDGSLGVLKGELDAMIRQRNIAAHVSLGPTAPAFDAPSVSLQRLKRIHPIVKAMYSWFC